MRRLFWGEGGWCFSLFLKFSVFFKERLGEIFNIGSFHYIWLLFPKEEVHTSKKDKHRTQIKITEI